VHEYSIVQALLDKVDYEVRSHGASRANKVRVSIGELAGVEIDLLKTAFDTIRTRTVCEDAVLEVTRVDARWACDRCGVPIEKGAPLRCPLCSQPARLKSGDEIMLDQIEVEAT
jgi:hydrogenase nickel incorporation protein HypA/HybF